MIRAKMSSFRLSPHAKAICQTLAEKLGVNMTAVIELALRQMAAREKVEVKP